MLKKNFLKRVNMMAVTTSSNQGREIDLPHLQTSPIKPPFLAVIGRILGVPVLTTVLSVFPKHDRKIRILFIYDELRTFVKKDLENLQEHFDVQTLRYTGKRDIPKLTLGILTTDLNFSWFALGYATLAVFFSKIFMKKSVVVAGGWDVVNMPEIGYGAMRSPKRVRKTKFALKHADKVLAVSESTNREVFQWVDSCNSIVVYNAFDYDLYKPHGEKQNMVITVGGVNKETLIKKGLKTFVESAKFLPNVRFVLIGKHIDDSIEYLKSIASPNVEFTGYVSFEELLKYYQKAKVYVQVSGHESFGCSLAEAMLCECVPVVTNRAALPEVVGDTGFYVPYDEPEQTAQAVKEALKSDKGPAARKRIKIMFPREKRKMELFETVNKLLNE